MSDYQRPKCLLAMETRRNAFLRTAVVLTSALFAATVGASETMPHGHGADARGGSAFGRPGDASKVARTIDVRVTDDLRFDPATIAVKRGETIRFRVVNAGQTMHEMVIGTPAELKAHAAMMRGPMHGGRAPDAMHDSGHGAHAGAMHDMMHSADHHASATHVPPGQRGEIVWQFTHAGRFQYACLVPGHFEAGMVGEIEVR